jgi:mannonate dehydratase
MRRRSLFAGAVAGGAGLVGSTARARPATAAPGEGARPAAASGGRVRFKVGCQSGPTDDERLQFFARHGVRNVCGYAPGPATRGPFTADELTELRERAAKWGVSVDMIALPFLHSSHIDKTERPAIMLGKSPERDRDIEHVQETIRACARAGIPAIKYNMSIMGVQRTDSTPGRGGVRYSTWRLREADPKKTTRAGRVTEDMYWERITYFLERVIPVAAEHKVKMACHPHDPGTPPGFRGVDLVLGTVEGLKKFVSIKESAYHGLNFCQGTVSEMLRDPGREIFDVIRYFGTRKKIFNVHFRNIRGRRDDFQEVFPDEGDIDFVRAIRTYREVGYDGMLMPDHVPKHPDDPGGRQAFAFCYGYIRALIQAVEATA